MTTKISNINQLVTKFSHHLVVSDHRTPAKNEQPPSPYSSDYSLAPAKILFATDEWFANADNLVRSDPPIFDPSLYCEQGKVMDGWETRRKRQAGHDWCVLALDRAYTIVAVEVDTAHFTGNHVPQISLQATNLTEEEASDLITKLPHAITRLVQGKGRQGVGCSADQVARAHEACGDWNEILPRTPLKPGYEETRMHYFTLSKPTEATHVRLNAHPDGGFARLKLWVLPQEESKNPPLYMPITTCQTVTVVPHSSTDKPPSRLPYDYPELSSEQLGGEGVACSNQHYGHPSQLLQSNLGKDMGDGWETARHPDRPAVWVKDEETHLLVSDLSDWAIIKLGKIVADGISRIILDTKHFRGNFPESVLVEGCFVEAGMTVESVKDWFVVVPRTKMAPDAEHVFDEHQIQNATRAVSHVRVTIFPDGGLSRVRVYGKPLEDHLLSHL